MALELIASGRARVVDERVVLDGVMAPDDVVINPAPE
jgi:hypothetical protein